jgi:capsular exopolysaccharide synthesis family protein
VASFRSGNRSPGREARGLIDLAGPGAEPFRMLRLALELRPETRRGKIVAFTSAGVGEGKSTVAANYALVAGLNQQRVLLIDADLRHPVLHEMFRVTQYPGLIDVLGRQRQLEDCVKRVHMLAEVDLLPGGTPVTRVGDLMASTGMTDLLADAALAYDTIVVDTPPVLEAPDASALAGKPGVDVVVVVDSRGRKRPVVKALHDLELIDANVLGLVVNRAGRLSSYGYGYPDRKAARS